MIEITNLTKKFGSTTAVENLSLKIEDGIYGLIGQNGAGKSTLFRLICNIYAKDEGSITIDGLDSSTQEAKKLFFLLPDNPYFEKNSKINETIELYSNFYDIDFDTFNELIDIFNLPRNKKLNGFSKGMLRQTFIALALSINCKYLFLDEAFDGLDPLVLETIKSKILEAKSKGKIIVASSHNVSTLEKLVDTFILITKGRLAGNDKNENIGKNYVKFQVFFKNDVTEDDLKNSGIDIVSFKKIGSIYHIVVFQQDNIEEQIKNISPTVLLEKVPIDVNEIVILNMLMAKKESEDEDK